MQPALFFRSASATSAGLLLGLFSFLLLFFRLGATGTRFGAASAALARFLLRLFFLHLSATCTRFGTASTALALLGTGQTGTGNQAGDTEPGEELFQLLLVHPMPPFDSRHKSLLLLPRSGKGKSYLIYCIKYGCSKGMGRNLYFWVIRTLFLHPPPFIFRFALISGFLLCPSDGQPNRLTPLRKP